MRVSLTSTEIVSHVTSDEPIVPFGRLNNFEERNLRIGDRKLPELVNGSCIAKFRRETKNTRDCLYLNDYCCHIDNDIVNNSCNIF